MLGNKRSEWMLIGLIVWLIVSAGILVVLLLTFVVPQYQLAQFIHECERQTRFQKPCAFCGMTTAFYALSRGDFIGAYRLNPLSPYIYAVFVLNTLCAVITLKHTTRFVKSLETTLRSNNVLS